MYPEDYNASFWGRDPGAAWEFRSACFFPPYHWGVGQGSNWVEPEYLLDTDSVGLGRGRWRGSQVWAVAEARWRGPGHQGHQVLKPWLLFNCLRIKLSVQFSHSFVSSSLWPHGLQHTRLPWLLCTPTPGDYSNSCPLNRWCHPTISSSVVPFSLRLQSFPASGSFTMSQFFTSGGQSIGASATASVLPMDVQDWFPLGWTGWISLQSKGLARVSSNTTV